MGTFTDFLLALFSLDFAWFLGIITNNLFWLFAFTALAAFFFPKKPIYLTFPVVTIYLWSSLEFANPLGWEVLTAGFLAFTYLTRVAGLTFAANVKSLQNKLSAVSITFFISTLFIWNLFLV